MTERNVPTITLPSGDEIPVLGQGTWGMAVDPRRRDAEVATLRTGIELGLTMIDTAESDTDGNAEELVAEAIAGHRDDVFLISKVPPESTGREETIRACERSIRHLRTDRLDLYLLHWRDTLRLDETIEALTVLITQGKIRHWGVGDFDLTDLAELTSIPGGTAVETDQVLYNLSRRGIEWELLPRCRDARLPVMAYSPFEQARLRGHPTLTQLADRHEATPEQICLAWVLSQDGVCAVPTASNPDHVRQNRAALEVILTEVDLAELDQAFPAPTSPRPLETL
ncbi:aldo/keto reductase [Micromonospora sonneratiae]|uniref:Aldo/keto reductase n=1 Tax=Micromonospora sonneratiae TaxID=1184706 RepID=A0ABW3YLJ6_9ACTN